MSELEEILGIEPYEGILIDRDTFLVYDLNKLLEGIDD